MSNETFSDLASENRPAKFAELFQKKMTEKQMDVIGLFKDQVVSDFANTVSEPVEVMVGEDIEGLSCGWVEVEEGEEIDEKKVVIRVSASGKKVKKVVCGPGKKLKGGVCVAQSGTEKLNKRKGSIKGQKKKKANVGGQKRALKLRAKALKKRKSFGL